MTGLVKGFLVAAMTAALALPAAAEDVQHRTEYSVSLGIVKIARAAFVTNIKDNRSYKVSGTISSAGLADLVTTISATTDVSGNIEGGRLRASSYTLFYKSGKKARTYDVRYSNGNITAVKVTPERKTPQNWVDVRPADMHAVLDPISGLIFPTGTNLCAQRLPIFDGEMRMDLALSPKGDKDFSTDGFSGKATVCSVRFTPRSGYKKGRKDIDYLARNGGMEIWFAKADAANVYAPVFVSIPTQYGTLTIKAVKYASS